MFKEVEEVFDLRGRFLIRRTLLIPRRRGRVDPDPADVVVHLDDVRQADRIVLPRHLEELR